MTKRRRMFDIEVPVGDAPAAPETKPARLRRGPMVTALHENAGAVRTRAGTEAAVRAENDRLTQEHVRLKRLGLITDLIALDKIDTTKLRRDRSIEVDPELDELVESIREIGLSNPIRVEQAGDRYELIQGWRRLQAYKALFGETGDELWSAIPAGMVPRGEDLVKSYRRMVDENLVRKDISFSEMATLATNYAADPQISCRDIGQAVSELYASSSYQKRSYIRAFAELQDMLGPELKYPVSVPRNLGLAVRRQIAEGRPGLEELRDALMKRPERGEGAELAILRGFVGGNLPEETLAPDPVPGVPEHGAAGPLTTRKTRTTFRLMGPEGALRCVAANGKLELRGATDFSGFDRRRLEAAVQAFLDALEA